jgi:N-acetylmuramoyl-L-alanine amidase
MDSNGWDDIGYNFLIGQDGNAYEGRGWNHRGAHSPNFNSISIGISFIGSFMDEKPNEAALNAGKALIECGVAQGAIQQSYGLMGHRQDIQTDCPGDALFAEIQTWPHWDPNPKRQNEL